MFILVNVQTPAAATDAQCCLDDILLKGTSATTGNSLQRSDCLSLSFFISTV